MTCMHDSKVNHISGFNLPHGVLNYPKHTKILNMHYSPILHGYMNTIKGRVRFKNFRFLLDIGCSYTIVMVRLVQKLSPKDMLQCNVLIYVI